MAGAYLAKKELGVFSLAFMGLSAMLGSGWLLASYFVFRQAGTYAPLSWLLGYVMVLVIALSFAETCSLIDRDGATVILPRLSHGYMLSAIFGFFGWISWVALIPIEVTAILQYLSFFVHGIYTPALQLSHFGMILASALVVAISVINMFAMSWIKSMNNYVFTPLKIGIPLLIIGYSLYHAAQLPRASVVHFHSFKGIFLAIPLGVVFSFNAFKTICVIAGRAHEPQKTIVRSLLLSLTTCLLLYLGLQYAYNLNVTAAILANAHSPYASILMHASIMLVVLYVGAVSSPFSANVFNLNAGNTCCYRMSKFGYMPALFRRSNRYHQYVLANVFNSLVALVLVLRSGSWASMVQNLTCIMVITYAAAPIALMAFRKNLRSVQRLFKLKYGHCVGFLGFLFSNFMIFWCGNAAVMLSLWVLLLVSVFLCAYHWLASNPTPLNFKRMVWVYLWLGGIAIISHFSVFGGTHQLAHAAALLCLSALSAVVYIMVLKSCLPEQLALQVLAQIKAEGDVVGIA